MGRVPQVSRDEGILLEEQGRHQQAFMPESALSPHQDQDLNPEAAADPAPNPRDG